MEWERLKSLFWKAKHRNRMEHLGDDCADILYPRFLFGWLTEKKSPANKLMRVFRTTSSKIFVMNQDSWFLSQLSRVSVRSIFGDCTWYRRTNFSITAVNFTDRELHRRLIDKTYSHDVWQNNFKILYSIVLLFGRCAIIWKISKCFTV